MSAVTTLPSRGIYASAVASSWTDGFITGNGEYGAILYGAPTQERVVFNYHRLVLPDGSRGTSAPTLSSMLDSARDQALAGDYSSAASTFQNGWTLIWTQSYHPAFELVVDTPGMTTVDNYVRITDFTTGEVSSTWTDSYGTWQRKAFVSRADKLVVHQLTPASGRTIDATVWVNTALDGVPSRVSFTTTATRSGHSGYLDVRGVYPSGEGAYGFEGVVRVVPTDGSLTVDGSTLIISGATKLVMLTRLDRYETSTAWGTRPLQTALAALTADYTTLLAAHTAIHGPSYARSTLDLNVSAADRHLSTPELIARQNANTSTLDLALLERLYDSGRYIFVSSCGILPPRLSAIWEASWTASWADDFTTDANVNLQISGGNITDLTDLMPAYINLILGQLGDWTTNATNVYGMHGYLAPPRTDGEDGNLFHFATSYPFEAWTAGADWLLYPLLEYYQVTGDQIFLATKLGPALMTLARFYEDFLSRTDSNGNVVFVPSYSPENAPASTGVPLSVNATMDIAAGKHALQAAIDAANALGLEQGTGQGVARWTALLAKMPPYLVNSDGALAEWSWTGLTDQYNHRHISHLYPVWPLHEINPEDQPSLVTAAKRALDLRGDENLSAHGSLHRALAGARLKEGSRLYLNLRKILGNNMVFPSLITSHNPNLTTYNADAANTIPAILAEALVYSRPGITELLPALPDQLSSGTITGIRGRNRVTVASLSWALADATLTAVLRSDIAQTTTLISRRGITTIAATAALASSPLGSNARVITLPAGQPVTVTIGLPATFYRLVNRNSGKVLALAASSTANGAKTVQATWTGVPTQQWSRSINADGSSKLINRGSGLVLDVPGSSTTNGTQLEQWTDNNSSNQWWKLVDAGSGYVTISGVRNGLHLDVAGSSTADGARVIQWPDNGAANQQWQLVAV